MRPLMTSLALLALLWAPRVAADGDAGAMNGLSQMSRLLAWEAYPAHELETAEALVVVHRQDDRELSVALVEVPSSHRWILSRQYFFKEGIAILQIADDASGWWIRLTERSSLKFKHVDDLSRPAKVAELFVDNPLTVTLEIEGTGWHTPFTVSSRLDDEGLYPKLFEQADFEGRTAGIIAGMPTATRSSLRALASLIRSKERDAVFDHFPNLLKILTATLDRHDGEGVGLHYRGTEWMASRFSGSAGKTLADDELAFIARFRSVPQDPSLLLLGLDRELRPAAHPID